MKKLIALLVVVAMFSAGCTGSFMLTKKVYNFHRDQDGKWMDELFFLGTVILPVYGLATLGDAIIFNSIEFWTDENPIEAKADLGNKVVLKDGDAQAILSYATEDGSLRIDSAKTSLILERRNNGVIIRDAQGNLLYTSVTNEDGSIAIYNAEHKMIKSVSANQVEKSKDRMLN